MKEPISTLSNAFYGVAGLLILRYQFAEIVPPGAFYVALSCVVLMVGSGLYHATLKRSHQAFDEVAMYMVLSSFVGMLVEMWTGVFHFGLFVWFGMSLMAYSNYKTMDSFRWVPIGVITLCILIGLQSGHVMALLVLLIFGSSAAIRQVGHKLGGVSGDVLHSVWHLGTAIGIYLSYVTLIS